MEYKQISMRLGHGGKREGAGRKKKNENLETRSVRISLDHNAWATIEFIAKFENKSKSQLVSELLADLLKEKI